MLDDPELRALFQAEAEEHLQHLDEALLRLEAEPGDQDTLDSAFRDAHSLKGAAGMMGLDDVQQVAHRFEDVLGAARMGIMALRPPVVDALYRQLDAIRALVNQAVTGAPAGVDVAQVLTLLSELERGALPAALPQLPIAPELSPPPPEPPRLPASPEGDSAESDLALEGVRSEPEPAPDPAPVGMLADPDLRALFQAEAEEHLQHLDQALLRLEAAPGDPEIVAGAFRDAHSLKGAAGMVGVDDVQQVAHRFEDVLGAARKGTLVLQPHVVDALYRQLDAMRALVKQAVTGVPAGVDVPQVLALLADLGSAALPPAPSDRAPVASAEVGSRGSLPAASAPPESTGRPTAADRTTPPPEPASSTGDPPGIVVSQASPDAVAGPRAPAPALPPASPDPGRYQITTVRVETERLDELMRQAGELNVTRVRILRRLADVDESLRHWEECVREVYLLRRHLLDLERAPTGAITPLAGANERLREKLEELGAGYRRLAEWMHEDSSRLHFVTEELEESIRSVRLLPLSNVFNLFPRVVRDLGREQGKQVQLVTEGGDTAADKRILEEIKDPLMHLIRNAVDHGIETPEERQRAGKPRQATIQLRASARSQFIFVEVLDDGRGLDLEAIRRTALRRKVCTEQELATLTTAQLQMLIFAPGFSTRTIVTDVSGRGVGMDVVRTNVERLKGTIRLESEPGRGCTVQIQLPVTLSTTHVLIAAVQGRPYAIPVDSVELTRLVSDREIFPMEGQDTLVHQGAPIPVAPLSELLELPETDAGQRGGPRPGLARPCLILAVGADRFGLLVDAMLDELEVVLKPLGAVLKRVRNVSGATILGSGEVCIVLNPVDLARSLRRRVRSSVRVQEATELDRPRSILLADDSLTTRTQEKRILESAGYQVVTAVDGLDAWNKLRSGHFDGVVSDVEMPNMTGFQFTAAIRAEPAYQDLPVILVTSLSSDEDRRRGLEAGANAYLTKPAFDQRVLLETLERLI